MLSGAALHRHGTSPDYLSRGNGLGLLTCTSAPSPLEGPSPISLSGPSDLQSPEIKTKILSILPFEKAFEPITAFPREAPFDTGTRFGLCIQDKENTCIIPSGKKG